MAEARGALTNAASVVCVAIDFGTSNSGYAYLFRGQNFSNAKCRRWQPHQRVKIPTCILIDAETSKYIKFGHEAHDEYVKQLVEKQELAEERLGADASDQQINELAKTIKVTDEGLFFQRFKMQLYDQDDEQKGEFQLPRTLRAECGGTMAASVVFRESLRFMKDEALKSINEVVGGQNISEDQIRWVITVPGMGKVQAKAFMRRAAEEAGLGDLGNVVLALEPEAAAIYIKEKLAEVRSLNAGDKYVLVDAGGGTIDFACHEVEESGVKETHSATGGPWGSTYLEKEFFKVINEILGDFDKFSQANPQSRLYFEDSWIRTKHSIKNFKERKFIPVPEKMMECYGPAREIKKKCISYPAGGVTYREGFGFGGSIIEVMFQPLLNKIVDKINDLLKNRRVAGSRHLVLVGGFASSEVLFQHLKDSFPEMTVLRPGEPEEAILLGAVFHEKKPQIKTRIMPLTYGETIMRRFLEGEDPVTKQIQGEDGIFCSDHFSVFVRIGESVKDDHVIEKTRHPLRSTDTSVRVAFYSSMSEYPRFIDDEGCQYVGHIDLEVPEGEDRFEKQIKILYRFGGSEITATVRVVGSTEGSKVFTMQCD